MKLAIIDTNIVSHILIDKTDLVLKRAATYRKGGRRFVMNPVVYFEFLRWILTFKDMKKRRSIHSVLEDFNKNECDWVDITHKISQKAAYIWSLLEPKNQRIEDADLLIAATAITLDCTIVTDNSRHFLRIAGLEVENWTAKIPKEI